MAKITQLPPAGPLDGSEVMPVVQDGETKGINPAVHLAYIALGAELARDQPPDLVLPQNIFVDAALGAAQAPVSVHTVLQLAESRTVLAQVLRPNHCGSAHLYTYVAPTPTHTPPRRATPHLVDRTTVDP